MILISYVYNKFTVYFTVLHRRQ